MLYRISLIGLLMIGLGSVANAADSLLPVIPKASASATAEGRNCVEPNDVMRRRHFEFILHQRDETMHRGIRTKKHSLKNCIQCHAGKDDSGQPIPINAPGQFCSACHEYAAVKIDCFECHSTVPAPKESGKHK